MGDGFDEIGIFLEYLMYLMGYFSVIIHAGRAR